MTTDLDHDTSTGEGAEPELIDQRTFEAALVWYYGLDSAMALAAVYQLKRANIGIPFTFVHERRWNDDGQEIGPILKVDEQFADLLEDIIEAAKWAALRVVAQRRRRGMGVAR